ncbi:MAG: phosphoenolpyruvate carboxykinase (GTP) [Halanaerobiales bacterium]|nr:phosphoenolpyruvate carboxykinase (GTP) [Halanaerobiales bacterium]
MQFSEKDKTKLKKLNNKRVKELIDFTIDLCKPEKVTVINDSKEDIKYVRDLAIKKGEEKVLKMKGHTYHFDGYHDQARDKKNTKYLVEEDLDLGLDINTVDRDQGLDEIFSYLEGSMKGKEMLVSFFSLGPNNSDFSLPAMQITDSSYVTHSEDILYRQGYQDFKNLDKEDDFFFFLHSAGQLKDGVSANIDKRRIYIDLKEDKVYSVNNQYAGNSLGLKKLAFRLAIRKAVKEGWLAEHMFISGVNGPDDRKTYFTGAFPSSCGKTSTAMIPGHTIVGDDIAYLKVKGDDIKAVNVENGAFGIIRDVNPDDDPIIYKTLTSPRELIFSNVLIKDGKPYWLKMGKELPKEGVNFSGKWYKGKKDKEGNQIPAAHKNARYTIKISDLENCDQNYDAKEGVNIRGIIFGGRDSDTSVPVAETLSWQHGVFIASSLESETTSATLDKQGERKHNPMANLDFLSVPFKDYINNYLKFGQKALNQPSIFTVNYFLKDEETKDYLNGMLDKKIWMLWMEKRVHGEVEAIESPIGYLPYYEDLRKLFSKYLNFDYTKLSYVKQFSIRIEKYLEKFIRMREIFDSIPNLPEQFELELNQQVKRLKEARKKYSDSKISPFKLRNY